jgi:hypothetical protein
MPDEYVVNAPSTSIQWLLYIYDSALVAAFDGKVNGLSRKWCHTKDSGLNMVN